MNAVQMNKLTPAAVVSSIPGRRIGVEEKLSGPMGPSPRTTRLLFDSDLLLEVAVSVHGT
jgi:hypothetical protein